MLYFEKSANVLIFLFLVALFETHAHNSEFKMHRQTPRKYQNRHYKFCSGNSSECRLEVAAARLADHGTWTCSLSQDKVRIFAFFGHGLGFVVSARIR